MKVSVVIPSFNDPRIVETIKSVKAQSYDSSKVEIVVQDAGSNDDVKGIISSVLGQHDKLICEKDCGIFDGINRGLKNASGDIILTLGTDDRIRDENLFARVEREFDQGFNFIYCGLNYTDENWRIIRRWPARKFSMFTYYLGYQFAHFALFCTPKLYDDIGYFNAKNPVNADYEFFYDALAMKNSIGIRASTIKSYSVDMKIGGNSSRSLLAILKSNGLIARFICQKNPLLLFGLLLKPVHKASEYLRAKAS